MANIELEQRQAGAAIVAIAPVVMLAAFLMHPYIGVGPPDQAAVAAAAADHTTRWGAAHLLTSVSSGLILLAFLAIRAWLRDTTSDLWSGRGVPLVAMGSVLYAILPGMEFAPLAAAQSGGDVQAAAETLVGYFVPIHVIGGLAFGAGLIAFRRGIADSRVLHGRRFQLVDCALIGLALSRLVPLAGIQFYVQGLLGVAALWPLAWAMRDSWARDLQPAAAD